MIFALIKAQCISLYRDRMAMLLTFALPCVMFTVFAMLFASGSGTANPGKLKVIVLDQDETRSSQQLFNSLKAMENLEVTLLENTIIDTAKPPNQSTTADSEEILRDARLQAAMSVRGGKAAAAVILPAGLEENMKLGDVT